MSLRRPFSISIAAMITSLWLFTSLGLCASGVKLNLYVAAGLKRPMDAVVEKFKQARPEIEVIPNYGPSGGLYAQILHGQPCDLFFSADWLYLEKLQHEGLLWEGVKFLSDRVVLVVSKTGAKKITTFEDLAKDGVVIAVADPRAPAGRYTENGLKKLGLLELIASKGNIKAKPSTVNQVAIMVKEDQVDAGFVFSSVASLYDLPAVQTMGHDLTGEIIFCIGIIKGGNVALARDFMNFARQNVSEFSRYGWKPYE